METVSVIIAVEAEVEHFLLIFLAKRFFYLLLLYHEGSSYQ